MIEHNLAFRRVQSPFRRGAGPRWNGGLHMTVERGTRHTKGAAGHRLAYVIA
jgi:hypothetical protein